MDKKKILLSIIGILLFSALIIFIHKNGNKLINIIIPFLIAMVIIYLIKPIIVKFEKVNISQKHSILIIYFIFLLIVTLVVMFVLPEFVNSTKKLIIKMPEITQDYQSKFYKFIKGLKIDTWPQEVRDIAFNKVRAESKGVQETLINNLKNVLVGVIRIATRLFDVILGMIIAYYLIIDEKIFKNMILLLAPKKWRNDIGVVGRETSIVLQSFIRGQLLTAFIIGILISIGLWILKIEYALVLGLIAGIANVIPYFGPILGAIPAVAVALLQSPVKALWVILLMFLIQQIDNIFISPIIIESKLGLHPVTTILAVLIGGEFFGIYGMLFAVPVFAILKIVSNRIIEGIV